MIFLIVCAVFAGFIVAAMLLAVLLGYSVSDYSTEPEPDLGPRPNVLLTNPTISTITNTISATQNNQSNA